MNGKQFCNERETDVTMPLAMDAVKGFLYLSRRRARLLCRTSSLSEARRFLSLSRRLCRRCSLTLSSPTDGSMTSVLLELEQVAIFGYLGQNTQWRMRIESGRIQWNPSKAENLVPRNLSIIAGCPLWRGFSDQDPNSLLNIPKSLSCLQFTHQQPITTRACIDC